MKSCLISSIMFLLLCGPTAAQEIGFRSPSGNIHCLMTSVPFPEVRCDLGDFTTSSKKPDDCELDWGFAFSVGQPGEGVSLCVGDTVRDPELPVLKYGQSIGLMGIACLSEETGVTCKNVQGHGFSLSRGRQSVF